MDGQQYQIKLKLSVDDREVDRAIAKIETLKGGTIGVGGGKTPLRRRPNPMAKYGNIPEDQRRTFRSMNAMLGRNPLMSNTGFLSGINTFFGKWKTFSGNFWSNMVSPTGIMRNISRLGGAISQLGSVALKASGAIGIAIGGIIKALKLVVAAKGIQGVVNLGSLYAGNRLLQSQNLGEAGSNIMQMQMAKRGLGGAYQPAMNEATRMATEYGFSRVGVLNAINMLSGLNTGKSKISFNEATKLAGIIGKISHVGGLNFEKVNTNIQQLLAQSVPNMRDIRELVGQAPFIGKLSMQLMERQGKSGDYRDWLKDKKNLLTVLGEFDKLIESNPVMTARGRVAVAKENFWIKLAGNNELWEKTASGMETFYSKLGDVVGTLIPKLTEMIDPAKIAQSMNDLQVVTSAFMTLLSGVSSFITGVGKGVSWVAENAKIIHPQSSSGAISYGSLGTNKPLKPMLTPFPHRSGEDIKGFSNQAKFNALQKAGIPVHKWADMMENSNFRRMGEGYGFSGQGLMFAPTAPGVDLSSLSGMKGTTGAGDELSDLTKGSRSLIINFNKEIVSMPVNIDTLNSGDDLLDKMRMLIPDMIVKGMNIAMNNAKSAM